MDLVLCGGGKGGGGGGGGMGGEPGEHKTGGPEKLGKSGACQSLHRVQKNCVKTDPPALQKLLQ